jgi:hypothetical protein
MLLEIKARPDYGTKSQAQFQQMDADVARVAQHRECAFLFVLDPKIYLSFSGEKTETRGRPAVAAGWFTATFPPIASIPTRGYRVLESERDAAQIEVAFTAIASGSGCNRILALGCRSDASF